MLFRCDARRRPAPVLRGEVAEKWIKGLTKEEALLVCGQRDLNLRLVGEAYKVTVTARDGDIRIRGEEKAVEEAIGTLESVLALVRCGAAVPEGFVARAVQVSGEPREVKGAARWARSKGQGRYVQALATRDVVCCIGPAGTGKTYLAVKMAVESLRTGSIRRLVLCRPAVEAGEKLGYLPGDLYAKVNPYLRPLYDALNEILDYDQVKRYLEREVVEVIPLAYMRGRTLSNSFIILDEGQNTTPAQLKMFLTRMGEGSKIVVTGDVTQIDLQGGPSGLVEASRILKDVEGIAWVYLGRGDIVRHPLVRRIVEAYEREGTGGT
jgi:phosphate starvation-inducible PhoH-like protein